MLCAKHVYEIEKHWDVIADRVCNRLRGEVAPHYAYKMPPSLVRERVEDLLGKLSEWLANADSDAVSRKYETLGMQRAAEGVPLHELVHVFQLIRRTAIDYSRENDHLDDRFAAYIGNDLAYRISSFFDLVIFHAIRGYESTSKPQPQGSGRMSQ